MEVVFFVARSDETHGVVSSHQLPGELATDPVTIDGPAALLGLAAALGLEEGCGLRQLRDATCRSYPVWALGQPLCSRLESLGDDEIDAPAEAWRTHADADLYERTTCLRELRDALLARSEDEGLFALVEERVL